MGFPPVVIARLEAGLKIQEYIDPCNFTNKLSKEMLSELKAKIVLNDKVGFSLERKREPPIKVL